MSRMLEEQQEELTDGYRVVATVKLETAMGGHAGSALTNALERWRWACALLSAEQQSASGEVAERVALSQQVEALELKLVAGWRTLATAKETVAAARQEAVVAHGRETAATLKMVDMESQLVAASQEGAAATSLWVRVESMSRMLEEQQQELADGYRLAATMKLGGVAGGRAGSALVHALERWRWACAQELQREQLQTEQLQREQLQREQLQAEQELKLREELTMALERAAAAEATAAEAKAAVTAAEGSASLLLTTMEEAAREAEAAAAEVVAEAEAEAARAVAAEAEVVAKARAEAVAVAHQAHQARQCHPEPHASFTHSYPNPIPIPILGPTLLTRLRWQGWRRRRRLKRWRRRCGSRQLSERRKARQRS